MPLRCPYCRSHDLRPASVQRQDTWVQRKLSQAYRCRKCARRSWRLERAIIGLALVAALVVATPLAFISYSIMTATPTVAPQAAEDAATVLHRRATSGDVAAQPELGRRHADGDGMSVNTSEATRWYAKAAETGDREGQYRYGEALLRGSGVVQDFQAALEWLKRAAEQNHAKAQRRLGQMYADGRGTPVDMTLAYVWLSLATARGEEDAIRLRDQVLMHLPAENVGKAQEKARELQARLNGATAAKPAPDSAPVEVQVQAPASTAKPPKPQ